MLNDIVGFAFLTVLKRHMKAPWIRPSLLEILWLERRQNCAVGASCSLLVAFSYTTVNTTTIAATITITLEF